MEQWEWEWFCAHLHAQMNLCSPPHCLHGPPPNRPWTRPICGPGVTVLKTWMIEWNIVGPLKTFFIGLFLLEINLQVGVKYLFHWSPIFSCQIEQIIKQIIKTKGTKSCHSGKSIGLHSPLPRFFCAKPGSELRWKQMIVIILSSKSCHLSFQELCSEREYLQWKCS